MANHYPTERRRPMLQGRHVVWWLCLTSCVTTMDAETPLACIETYSEEQGWGVDNDPVWWGRFPEAVARDCELFGDSCNADDFITRRAAQCIAELDGLEPGLQDWSYSLGYDEPLGTVRWRVEMVAELGDDASGGDFVAIHAETGVVIDRGTWRDEAI